MGQLGFGFSCFPNIPQNSMTFINSTQQLDPANKIQHV